MNGLTDPNLKPISVGERLFSKIERLPWSGCWIFMGGLHYKGYGEIAISPRGKKAKTHRVAWEVTRGPIPTGMFVCHSCDIPSCVNPDHLWLGTNRENLADAGKKGRLSANHYYGRKKHCPAGHAYDATNTYRDKRTGGRHCKACHHIRQCGSLGELEGQRTEEPLRLPIKETA